MEDGKRRWMPGLNQSVDGLMQQGHHAKVGTERASIGIKSSNFLRTSGASRFTFAAVRRRAQAISSEAIVAMRVIIG
jgi:hypothetical protein